MKVEKNLLEITFISLSAKVITRMSSETLFRTLNTPSGKEMSLQFDRSAGKEEERKKNNGKVKGNEEMDGGSLSPPSGQTRYREN